MHGRLVNMFLVGLVLLCGTCGWGAPNGQDDDQDDIAVTLAECGAGELQRTLMGVEIVQRGHESLVNVGRRLKPSPVGLAESPHGTLVGLCRSNC
jgi:hypothetical protein